MRCPQYVTDCFSNHQLFHKALKEAFEAFCNRPVGVSSSAELMASFCDNLLKKVHLRACCRGSLSYTHRRASCAGWVGHLPDQLPGVSLCSSTHPR